MEAVQVTASGLELLDPFLGLLWFGYLLLALEQKKASVHIRG